MIVGKRALPALALRAGEVALLARAEDIAIAYGAARPWRRPCATPRPRAA